MREEEKRARICQLYPKALPASLIQRFFKSSHERSENRKEKKKRCMGCVRERKREREKEKERERERADSMYVRTEYVRMHVWWFHLTINIKVLLSLEMAVAYQGDECCLHVCVRVYACVYDWICVLWYVCVWGGAVVCLRALFVRFFFVCCCSCCCCFASCC